MPESISVFFPCYNDAGTIASMVLRADQTLKEITNDYEIIVIDDGSADESRDILEKLKLSIPYLKLIFHKKNKGYGGALRSGFQNASKELIFYTDGDAQYDVKELKILLEKLTPDIDIVNGYKIKRHDPPHRIIIGYIYQYLIKFMFGLKIKDVDCDFRLMRKKIFDRVTLVKDSGVICIELVKKIQQAGFKFAQAPVHHFFRLHGRSQFFNFKRIFHVGIDIIKLWFTLVL